MWLHFSGGRFVSIVAVHPFDTNFRAACPAGARDDILLVRGRLKGDVETFLRVDGGKHIPVGRDTTGRRDYQFRAYVPVDRVKAIVAALASCITYSNFKGTIDPLDRHRTRWHDRAWHAALTAQEDALNDEAACALADLQLLEDPPQHAAKSRRGRKRNRPSKPPRL
jgi:hypothetical protein